MMFKLLAIVAAAAMLACGWFASAWFYKRKIADLQARMKAIRETATQHVNQARRQIGQLQAELANRPPAPSAQRAGGTAVAAGDSVAPVESEPTHIDPGFATTQIADADSRPR